MERSALLKLGWRAESATLGPRRPGEICKTLRANKASQARSGSLADTGGQYQQAPPIETLVRKPSVSIDLFALLIVAVAVTRKLANSASSPQ